MNGYNFTPHVRRALAAARENAARLGSEYLRPEHILLGILDDDDQTAGAAVLMNLGVTQETLCREIEGRVSQPRSSDSPAAGIPYASSAKRVLEAAMTEAARLGHSYVGTEHLLLGIVSDPKSDASTALAGHGATLDRVRQEVARLPIANTQAGGSAELAAGTTAAVRILTKDVRLAMRVSWLALLISLTALVIALVRRP